MRYVIAQRGRQLALVHGDFDETTRTGDTFDRMPGTQKERWIVVKVFDRPDQDVLAALETLHGPGLADLFDIKFIENVPA